MERKFRRPTTKLEDFVQYQKSRTSELNAASARIQSGFDQSEVYQFFRQRLDQIEEKYKPLLNPADFYFFKTLSEFGRFILDLDSFDEERILEDFQHEQEHCVKAQEKGYVVEGVGCYFVIDEEGKEGYVPGIQILLDSLPDVKDFKDVALAPTTPSPLDKDIFR